ncbi:MAG: hypothetical protein WD489_05550 [Rhodovibrionaceae bacterium]
MAWQLHGSGSATEIRPGRQGGYASFPEARRAALARLDSGLAGEKDPQARRDLEQRRAEIAQMTAAEVSKDLLSGPGGVDMEAAMEMVQVELGRARLARRPALAAFVVLLVAVLALLSLFNG